MKKNEISMKWSMFELREIKWKQDCMIVGLREKKRRECTLNKSTLSLFQQCLRFQNNSNFFFLSKKLKHIKLLT